METVHAPAPSAPERLVKRAKATIFPSTAKTISASVMRMASRTSLDQEVQEPEPNQVPTTPVTARPSATAPDCRNALTCEKQT